jgi:hypothetical protein
MFAPEVERSEADGLDIKFHRCPLQQAGRDADLAPEEVATLCRIAAQVDSGMFEGAGCRFHADTRFVWTRHAIAQPSPAS